MQLGTDWLDSKFAWVLVFAGTGAVALAGGVVWVIAKLVRGLT